MAMPRLLVLVRHGKSEGNVAKKLSQKGDDSIYQNPDFTNRHSSQFRLVDEGRKQAELSGDWIRANVGSYFDRYYVSGYIRAMETAAYLGLHAAQWFPEFNLRERNWGDLDVMPESIRHERFAESMLKKEITPFYWKPNNGESIAECCMRVDRVIDTLHRECDGKRVVVVSHGELMWAWRVRLERMSEERYLELDRSRDPKDHIDNGHILMYTREDPLTGRLAPYLNWMKSISPSHPEATRDEWQEIVRPRYTNEELLAFVQRVPQVLI